MLSVRSRRVRRPAVVVAVVVLACAAVLVGAVTVPAPASATAPVATPVAQAGPTLPPAPADPTPVPNPSSSSDVIVTPDFEPPAALCPGPVGQVDPPGVRVRIGDGQPIAATMGSGGSSRAAPAGNSTSVT